MLLALMIVAVVSLVVLSIGLLLLGSRECSGSITLMGLLTTMATAISLFAMFYFAGEYKAATHAVGIINEVHGTCYTVDQVVWASSIVSYNIETGIHPACEVK